MELLDMGGNGVPLVGLKAAAEDAAVELAPELAAVDCLLVRVELLVGDEVHVALGAPVAAALRVRGQVRLQHVGLAVPKREEAQLAADALVLAGDCNKISCIIILSPNTNLILKHTQDVLLVAAAPSLDVLGQVGEVVPTILSFTFHI